MLDIFEKKDIEDFSKSVKDVFNLLSISRKYRVVGSSSLKNARFVADYDLNEVFNCDMTMEQCLDKILLIFREKFKEAEKNPNIFITDFKCGEDSNGEPLRWDKNDMKRGYKIMDDGRKILFQECVLMKTTMKLDLIALIDGRFSEFSDNYYIKIGDKSNFFLHDIEEGHLLTNLQKDFSSFFYSKRNYFKALKRAFSYWMLEGETKNKEKLTKLLDFFNSGVGLMYKLKSELETIKLVIENKFRKPKLEDLKRNIELILTYLNRFSLMVAVKHLENSLKSKSNEGLLKYIEKTIQILYNAVNSATTVFLIKNPELILVKM